MGIRARFAPSPTGHVHIGNIRTAIFNWLFTRHAKGEFLLRIEDTDLERSTKEAIDTLLDCMKWLGLDYDGEALYQSSRSKAHLEAAHSFISKGCAYRLDESKGSASPVVFRIPYDCSAIPFVTEVGPAEIALEPGSVVSVSRAGLSFKTIGPKGKSADCAGCLAGFKDLKILGASGEVLFDLSARLGEVRDAAAPLQVEGCHKLSFLRREAFYEDLVKGRMAKPLDGMKDLIIVRGDGSPVFHLANVLDDIEQKVTHIVRGDDHVENTYRHLFLFAALGAAVPAYAHMPMIVNASGKPYSKRDGDAFVGDFREKGFLPQALFNYLALLGWSPGDDREKMSRQELVDLFTIDRVKSSPAQFDINKLLNMNGLYIAEMPFGEFSAEAWGYASKRLPWLSGVKREAFDEVGRLMQIRTKTFADIANWRYFLSEDYDYDQKALRKHLGAEDARKAAEAVAVKLEGLTESDPKMVEEIIHAVEGACGIQPGKLNQPLRVAVTGTTIGAGVYETIALLGGRRSADRIRKALSLPVQAAG